MAVQTPHLKLFFVCFGEVTVAGPDDWPVLLVLFLTEAKMGDGSFASSMLESLILLVLTLPGFDTAMINHIFI